MPPESLTKLLQRMQRGDRGALNQVYEESYEELRAIARGLVRRERPGGCSATELVNEVFLRKLREGKFTARNRGHFYAIATRAMRAVLVEQARERLAAKRNSGIVPAPLDELAVPAATVDPAEIVSLDRHFSALEELDPQAAHVFALRFFLGHTQDETAEIVGKDPFRLREDWEYAKAWLRDRVNQDLQGSR